MKNIPINSFVEKIGGLILAFLILTSNVYSQNHLRKGGADINIDENFLYWESSEFQVKKDLGYYKLMINEWKKLNNLRKTAWVFDPTTKTHSFTAVDTVLTIDSLTIYIGVAYMFDPDKSTVAYVVTVSFWEDPKGNYGKFDDNWMKCFSHKYYEGIDARVREIANSLEILITKSKFIVFR